MAPMSFTEATWWKTVFPRFYSSSTTTSGTQLELSSTTLAGASVSSDYKLVPDGSRVVYQGALSKDNVVELYSASTVPAGRRSA